MDLSIFGATRAEYKQYAINIRKEYIHVEDSAYQKGRSEVLKHFLPQKEGETIFKSQLFIDLLEKNAIDNINWEIDQLKIALIAE